MVTNYTNLVDRSKSGKKSFEFFLVDIFLAQPVHFDTEHFRFDVFVIFFLNCNGPIIVYFPDEIEQEYCKVVSSWSQTYKVPVAILS